MKIICNGVLHTGSVSAHQKKPLTIQALIIIHIYSKLAASSNDDIYGTPAELELLHTYTRISAILRDLSVLLNVFIKGPISRNIVWCLWLWKKVQPIICTIGCIKVFSGPLGCKKAAAALWSIWPSSGTTHSQVIIWLWTSWSLSNFEHGKHMCPNEIANAIYRPCFEIWTASEHVQSLTHSSINWP